MNGTAKTGLAAAFPALVAGLALAGCGDVPGFGATPKKPTPPPTAAVRPVAIASTADDAVEAAKAALMAQNLGLAADLAAKGQTQFPRDNRLHLLRAQAEARLGNAGDSAGAFLLALDTGLAESAQALNASDFDDVRDSKPFVPVLARLGSLSSANPASAARLERRAAPPRVTSRVRAGDVEIIETTDGASVRAGDVRLDADD